MRLTIAVLLMVAWTVVGASAQQSQWVPMPTMTPMASPMMSPVSSMPLPPVMPRIELPAITQLDSHTIMVPVMKLPDPTSDPAKLYTLEDFGINTKAINPGVTNIIAINEVGSFVALNIVDKLAKQTTSPLLRMASVDYRLAQFVMSAVDIAKVHSGLADPNELVMIVPQAVIANNILRGPQNTSFNDRQSTFPIRYNDGMMSMTGSGTRSISQTYTSTAPGGMGTFGAGRYGWDPATDSVTRTTWTSSSYHVQTIGGYTRYTPYTSAYTPYSSPFSH